MQVSLSLNAEFETCYMMCMGVPALMILAALPNLAVTRIYYGYQV